MKTIKIHTELLCTNLQSSVLKHLLKSKSYTPYGYISTRERQDNYLGFNGQKEEALTGLYLLGNGHRALSPVLMRFQSPDSLSPFDKGGINAYGYCAGDPINHIDPTGQSFIALLKGNPLTRVFEASGHRKRGSPLYTFFNADDYKSNLYYFPPRKTHFSFKEISVLSKLHTYELDLVDIKNQFLKKPRHRKQEEIKEIYKKILKLRFSMGMNAAP